MPIGIDIDEVVFPLVSEDIPVILFRRTWNEKHLNQSYRNITPVRNWEQAIKVARAIY